MNTTAILHATLVFASVCIALILLDKKRIRSRWGKSVLAICAVAGISMGGAELGRDFGWFLLDSESAYRFENLLFFGRGLMLGFLLSLIFSGQLIGAKRTNEAKSPEKGDMS